MLLSLLNQMRIKKVSEVVLMINLNKIVFVFIFLLCQSCASRNINIRASTPSRIEMNGETVCNSTPCNIMSGICWVHGPNLNLVAFPLDKAKGYTQKKEAGIARCNAFSSNEKNIYFEMDSREGVAVELMK